MPLILYDHAVSSNALKVRFLLAELGEPYTRREVPMERPRPAWYLEENPVGGIPAIRDGALVLSESNAILRYLAARAGAEALYPADPAERASVDEALDRFSLVLRPALFRHEDPALGFVAGKGFGARPRDPEAARRAATEIAPTLALFDGLVGDEGYAALGRFTIADCAAAPALFRTGGTGLDLGPYAGLRRWRERLTSRPAFAAAGPVL